MPTRYRYPSELDAELTDLGADDYLVAQKAGESRMSKLKPAAIAPGDIGAAAATHKSRHATGGADALAPTDIGALPASGGTLTGDVTRADGCALYAPGASSNPVYAFAADTDTGIANTSTNCRGRTPAGTLRAYWGGDGNVRAAASADATGTYYFGTSSIYWAGVYAQGGNLLTSDARKKTDIIDSDLGLAFIQALRPVRYRWVQCGYVDADGQTQTRAGIRPHYGLLAQEVQTAMGERDFAGFAYDPDGDAYCLRYEEFIAPLIKAVQELAARVSELEAVSGGASVS